MLSDFKPIRLFVFDIDGVLTDGNILLMDNGEQVRKMSIKDGYALQMAIKKGYYILVISGARQTSVIHRLALLGVEDVYAEITDKVATLQEYIKKLNLRAEEVLFMGDDMPDMGCLQIVGVPCCPADAVPEVKEMVHYISPFNGGQGCVRDVIEKVLKLNSHWVHDAPITSQ
ncbi:MAG: HAD hydrolase family protein [Sphingobacteriales bacterium]|nr:HAD hydrolase family protein [Sphingobacteriales bacterium]